MVEELARGCMGAVFFGFFKLVLKPVLPQRHYEALLAAFYPEDAAALKAKRARRKERRRAARRRGRR